MTNRIRIKIGAVELEQEGTDSFSKDDVLALLKAVSELNVPEIPEKSELGGGGGNGGGGGGGLQGTTGAFAAKLNAKTGGDLVTAAAARLSFALGKATFARSELTDEMKTATAYYKQTFVKNLTATLDRLIKDGVLLEPTKDTFSLSATGAADLKTRLA